ncbi:response regulator [Candidatus Peregrinibacteria bacterium]|nr:MAG: response regulator [Candidatus Peregrinibacteria bacterium]
MKTAFNTIRVLIAEDDPNICKLYSLEFMRHGFVVYTANDGRQAIQKFKNKEPDIVLLDIMMPHADGYQVLREIRKELNRYVPVMMLTNLDVTEFTDREAIDFVDAYLVKSNYTPSEVVERAIEVLRLNKLLPVEVC